MQIFFLAVISAILSVFTVAAHMSVRSPCPRASPFCNSHYLGRVNYDIEAPYNYGPEPELRGKYPCREQAPGPSVATYRAGQSVQFVLKGTANHDGGHCQYAISYDNGRHWAVLRTVFENCLTGNGNGPYVYDIQLPKSAPGGKAVLSWVFYNKEGDQEMYMNCIDVNIQGPRNGTVHGKELLVLRLPGASRLNEWKYGGSNGADMFNHRRNVVIDGRGGFCIVSGSKQWPQVKAVKSGNRAPHKGFQRLQKNRSTARAA